MRGKFLRNWRVPAATLFSIALIVGAYVLARGVGDPPVAQAFTETALLQAIATKDSNGDGLPDWEKPLYGIPVNSTTTDYFHLGMTDGEAVAKGLIVPKAIADIPIATSTPVASTSIDYATYGLTAPTEGTLTDTFAKDFFTLYLSAEQTNGGVGLTASQENTLAEQAITELLQQVSLTADFKNAKDLAVYGTGTSALKNFAVAAGAVLKENAVNTTMSGVGYLQSVVEDGNTSALANLVILSNAYRKLASGIAVLQVPQELAPVDLVIINSIMRLSEIYADFARVNTDPLAAIFALQQYPSTELNVEDAFTTLANIYAVAGVTLPAGTPGALFVNAMANMTARQQAATGKQ